MHGDLHRRHGRSAGDDLIAAVSEKARAVKVGPGREADSEMGPVVTSAARDRIVGLIGTGEDQGARLAVDGRGLTVPGHENGFWVGPTVIDEVTPSMDVYTEEIFGPVLSVVRADTVDAAINLINSNPYGNGTAIFTSSGEAARRFQRGVNVGMIGINVPIPVPMAYYSFGGWKDSLFGAEPHPRARGRRLLHPGEGRDVALAPRRGRERLQLPLPHVELTQSHDDHASIVCDLSESLLTCSCSPSRETPAGWARGPRPAGPDLIRPQSPHHQGSTPQDTAVRLPAGCQERGKIDEDRPFAEVPPRARRRGGGLGRAGGVQQPGRRAEPVAAAAAAAATPSGSNLHDRR